MEINQQPEYKWDIGDLMKKPHEIEYKTWYYIEDYAIKQQWIIIRYTHTHNTHLQFVS